MLAVVLTFAVTVFFLTVAFFSKNEVSSAAVSTRLDDMKISESDTGEKKSKRINVQKLMKFLGGTNAKKKKNAKPKKESKSTKELDKLLMLAGFDLNASQWNTLKYGGVILMSLLTYVICGMVGVPSDKILLVTGFVGAITLLLISNTVTSKVKKKKESIRTDLPDIIDLLVVCVEAGLGFDAALLRLYEKNKCPIMEELVRTSQDIRRGVSKKDAYSALMTRCDCREITAFSNAVLQAEQMGISMKNVLTAQSEQLRDERTDRAHEQAEKAPIKMMIPMVVFIFPCIFVILLAPAAVSIIGAFS